MTTDLTRRRVLVGATVSAGAAAATIAAPSTASAAATQWSWASPFDRSRDAIRLPVETMLKNLAALTDGAFKLGDPDQSTPDPSALFQSVASGKYDAAHMATDTLLEASPVFALAAGTPFGLNARMHTAWLQDARGLQLINTALAAKGVVLIPAGQTGASMGGWFRRDLTDVAQLKDLKIAIGGLGARIFEALGAKPQSVGRDDLGRALRNGDLDGAIYGLPYDDENLRLYQSAQALHYPGWWNGAGQLFLVVNKAKYDALSPEHRTALDSAAAIADRDILARYDAQNPTALKRAVASGARLQPLTEAFLDTCFKASSETLTAIATEDAAFKEIHDSLVRFRRDAYLWSQLSENTFDTYMMIQQRKQAL
ncbi:MAG: ABC transporter substrate-binding protein [Pseudomonadota bacterium]